MDMGQALGLAMQVGSDNVEYTGASGEIVKLIGTPAVPWTMVKVRSGNCGRFSSVFDWPPIPGTVNCLVLAVILMWTMS
jgi:hypothetical protein